MPGLEHGQGGFTAARHRCRRQRADGISAVRRRARQPISGPFVPSRSIPLLSFIASRREQSRSSGWSTGDAIWRRCFTRRGKLDPAAVWPKAVFAGSIASPAVARLIESLSDDRNSPWARIASSHSIAIGDEVERDPAHRRDGYPEKEPAPSASRASAPAAPIRRRRRRSGETGGDRDDACSRGTRHEPLYQKLYDEGNSRRSK